jgi:hypothetical protein
VDAHRSAFHELFQRGCLQSKTEPIQQQYLQLVERAQEKILKYRWRGLLSRIFHVSKEAVRNAAPCCMHECSCESFHCEGL